jgi:hypothetical protein
MIADDLVLALRVVDADATPRHDAEAVLRLEAKQAQGRAEHHAFDLRVGILEREVHVPGVPHPAVRELALDPHLEELLLEQRADPAGQLRDSEDPPDGRFDQGSGIRDSGLGGILFRVRLVGLLKGQIEQAAHAR